MRESPLDDIDRAILFYLQEDGRRAITDVADDVGVSDNTVRNRVAAMEEAGAIDGYAVEVNYEEAGVQHHYLFVCTARVSERDELADEARGLSGVTEVITLMTGTHNVYVVGAASVKDEMTDLATTIDGLGLTVEREHLVRDHFRQPYSGFDPPEFVGRN